MSKPWRTVFLGTPDFAVPSLSALAEGDDEILAVVCQPDRPKGRGRRLSPPPVKVRALELGLDVRQPKSIRAPEVLNELAELSADLFVLVAFGQLLPKTILEIPRLGVINLHPSLLPKYRGPAPINWALINGETETGATTMLLDEGVDTGPIYLSEKVAVGEAETAGELTDRLAVIGASLLKKTIAGLKNGSVVARPQPAKGISRGRLLTKEDGKIDWTRPAGELAAQVRGTDPWPGAHTVFQGQPLKLFGGRTGAGQGQPGQVLALEGDFLHVAAGKGSLAMAELQLAGKKRQPARDFWHGQRLGSSDFFGR